MRATIAVKLYLSLGLMVALLIASAAFIVHSTSVSRTNYERLYQSTRGAALLAHAQSDIWQLRYGVPQFMVGDPAARAEIVADESKWYREINEAFDAYARLDISPEEHQALAALLELYQAYTDARPRWFDLYGSGEIQEAADWRAETTTPLGAATVQALADLIDLQQKVDVATQAAVRASADGIRKAVIPFIALSLIIAALVAFILLRTLVTPLEQLVAITRVVSQGDFTQRLRLDRHDEFGALYGGFNHMIEQLTLLIGEMQQSGIQVDTSVNQIAATVREQQATASAIAATTTEIGATSKEISATSKKLVATMDEVFAAAEQSAILAGSGQASLSRMEETMRNVTEAADSINAKLAVLNEKAGKINQVVTTITKVADQTNLLSLNAAIEAEKAGESGRGFAVVATEIRRLADQTEVATYDIEQMVKTIQSAVSAGVMGMDKFSEEVRRGMHEAQQASGQLTQIIQQVQAMAPRFEVVHEGMQAQSAGAEQISQTLIKLSDAARQTVDSLSQSSEAIDGMNHAFAGMRSSGERFRLQAA